MSQVFTRDKMEPVPLHGRVYPVVDGVVSIPTVNGVAEVTLDTSGKRKDWLYVISYKNGRFIHACWESLIRGLPLIVREEDIVDG